MIVGAIIGGLIGFVSGCAYTTAARRRFVASFMPPMPDYLDADMGRGGWDHDFHDKGNAR